MTGGTAQDDIAEVTITVPTTTEPADDTRLVVVEEGSAVGAERTIDVVGATIKDVEPDTIRAVPGATVFVFGKGFSEGSPGDVVATAGTLPLEATERSDTKLTLKVGTVPMVGAPVAGDARLRITIREAGTASTPVKLSTGSIQKVVPSTISLAAPTLVSIAGSDFGERRGEVRIGQWQLEEPIAWKDTVVQGTLDAANVPAIYDTPTEVGVMVVPPGRAPIVSTVNVKK